MNPIDPEIIVAVLAGEASEEEERLLAEWRAATPENEREFRRLARIWAATGELDAVGVERRAPDARSIVERAESRSSREEAEIPAGLAAEPETGEKPVPAHRHWRLPALAAALVLGLGLGTLLSRSVGVDEAPFGPKALVTGADEVATVTLNDETVVRLAPGSRLEFSREEDTREVSLDGRAFFAVAPQREKPFRVRLPTEVVEVLGTRFDVESRDDRTQVAVVEGEVRLEADGGGVSVGANQIASSANRGAPEVRQVDDVYQVINWLGRFLAFESTEMEQVAEEMERRFGLHVEIADSGLRERTVTAWFSDQSPEEMMASICRAVNARCLVRNGTVRMEELSTARTSAPASAAQGARR